MLQICKKCSCYYQPKSTKLEWIELMMATIGLDPRKTSCFGVADISPPELSLTFPTPWDFRHLILTRLTSVLAVNVTHCVFAATLTMPSPAQPTTFAGASSFRKVLTFG